MRTTSLTVPPSASLIVLKRSRRTSTTQKFRYGPGATLNGVCGGAFMAVRATSPTPAASSRARPSVVRGSTSASTFEARPAVVRTAPSTPRAISSARVGSRCGTHGSGSGTSVPSGERSKSTVARSTPDTPSTSAWWVLEMIAKRPSSSPSTR